MGELALTGETRPVKGIRSMALWAVAENREGLVVHTAIAAVGVVVRVRPLATSALLRVHRMPEQVGQPVRFSLRGL